MGRPAKKKQEQTRKEEPQFNVETAFINQVIRSINNIHETTDRKLRELSASCMDKKCNE